MLVRKCHCSVTVDVGTVVWSATGLETNICVFILFLFTVLEKTSLSKLKSVDQ